MAKTVPCEGAVRCRGKVVAKSYGCDRPALCAAHKDGLCVPCQEGEEPEGGEEEELVEDPNGVSIEQCAPCLLPVGTTTGHFLLSRGGVGGRWLPPSLMRRLGGSQATPISAPWPRCAMGRHCPGPPCKGMWGLGCRRGAFWW